MGCGAGKAKRAESVAPPAEADFLERPGTAAALRSELPPETGGSPRIGGLLKVRRSVAEPVFRWGRVTVNDVGVVRHVAAGECIADFANHTGWRGHLSDVERFHPRHPPDAVRISGAPSKRQYQDVNGVYDIVPETAAARWAGAQGVLWRGWVKVTKVSSFDVKPGSLVEIVPQKPPKPPKKGGKKAKPEPAPVWDSRPARGTVIAVDQYYVIVHFERSDLRQQKIPHHWWDSDRAAAHHVTMPFYPEYRRRVEPTQDEKVQDKMSPHSLLSKRKRMAVILTLRVAADAPPPPAAGFDGTQNSSLLQTQASAQTRATSISSEDSPRARRRSSVAVGPAFKYAHRAKESTLVTRDARSLARDHDATANSKALKREREADDEAPEVRTHSWALYRRKEPIVEPGEVDAEADDPLMALLKEQEGEAVEEAAAKLQDSELFRSDPCHESSLPHHAVWRLALAQRTHRIHVRTLDEDDSRRDTMYAGPSGDMLPEDALALVLCTLCAATMSSEQALLLCVTRRLPAEDDDEEDAPQVQVDDRPWRAVDEGF
eukprot:TRINITY_DN13129_c0_g1_i1.p1 TRINITY_DN13129_c0_g1~~TRINITY_DN13129_c0_g1_i1.p1  ORF type:complete len:546 (+),score=186.15 TRINITY_DN13129_c0_g1_i1:57-1694(+)